MDHLPDKEKQVLQIKDGPICGFIESTKEGTYYKFKKIPYAKPPTGALRFRPPYPVETWTNLLDCTLDAPMPIGHGINEIEGSEDCLYIEISTPSLKPQKLLPVMFWIGSSYFVFYFDNLYDPSLINNQDIVFVRCGFRLGPFGFLSINDISAPGNNGLKDIIMALKWVQNNISIFGGDPNNITIFGNSSGGSIVHLMILSPLASGLFHKAIMQSSSALNRWSVDKNPAHSVMKLAKELCISKTDIFEVIEELKNTDAIEIMNATKRLCIREICNEEIELFDTIFKPCIEEEFEGVTVFMNKSPVKMIKSGNFNKVPIIIGSNNIDTSFLKFVEELNEDFEKFNLNPSLVVNKSLASLDDISAKRLGRQLIDFYFNGKVCDHNITQFLQIFKDYHYLYYVNKTIRFHIKVAQDHPIYYYIVNFAGEWTVPEKLKCFTKTGHLTEIPFLFRIKSKCSPHYEGSLDSIITRNRVVKLWTNFAKYGNPTPYEGDPDILINWDPVENIDNLNYLSIDRELTKGKNPFHERMKLWDKIHDESLLLRALIYFNDVGITW